MTDAIHSAARNENTTFFRLPQLARQTLQGTGPVQPVNLEQASSEVDLDRFAPPLPPTPLLLPGVSAKKPGLLIPVLVGVASIVVLAGIAIVIAVSLDGPSPAVVVARAASPAAAPPAVKKAETKTAVPSSQQLAAALAATATSALLEAGEPPKGKTAPTQPTEASKKATEASSKERSVRQKKDLRRGRKARALKRRAKRRRQRARRARARRARRRALAARRRKRRRSRRRAASRSNSRRRGNDNIDSLLAAATTKSRKRPTRVAMAGSSPKALDRSQIQAGVRGVRGPVSRCYHKYKVPGLARVRMKVDPRGRVASTQVKGTFAGTPTGACIAAATKRARFPRFSGPSMTFVYPFVLR